MIHARGSWLFKCAKAVPLEIKSRLCDVHNEFVLRIPDVELVEMSR
ncbi:hypothetical protein AWB69_03079 [Caballeronia udeis]|uniref:Uncharacterized protein n=1 Tax=Caballeronia udeis TaxID=1232866 RepID=A0A158GPD7_9BURK|nr:hypothetical protein AWB69_03079 [Caballeronia udeis]